MCPMLRGQRSQVRKRGGEGAQWGQPEESPPGQDEADPSARRGRAGGGLVGLEASLGAGFILLYFASSTGLETLFPGGDKRPAVVASCPAGRAFRPQDSVSEAGASRLSSPGERSISEPLIAPPPLLTVQLGPPPQILSRGAQSG